MGKTLPAGVQVGAVDLVGEPFVVHGDRREQMSTSAAVTCFST